MLKPVIVLGAGGHGKVIADIVVKSGGQVSGFLDDNRMVGSEVLGFPMLGKIAELPRWQSTHAFLIGIGTNEIRKQIACTYKVCWHTAIHPSASIAMDTEIAEGTVIMANAVVNASARIGRHCIINSGAIIEHDNVIGDYSHLSPGVALGGAVTIGTNVQIAIGATVRNGIHITNDTLVGAGAVVVKDITESGTYVGVPARKMK